MRRPSLPTVLGLLALFFALGGTAIAAKHYIITSTSQIKPNVLNQLRGKRGPAGANGTNGAQGAQGPAGAQGPPGPANLSEVTVARGPEVPVPPGEVGSASVFCPSGMRAVSGGGSGGIAGLSASETSARVGWFIITVNNTGITVNIHAIALCAGAGKAVAAAAPSHAQLIQQVHEQVATLKAELAASGR